MRGSTVKFTHIVLLPIGANVGFFIDVSLLSVFTDKHFGQHEFLNHCIYMYD